MWMKVIQVMMDPDLLAALDSTEEALQEGRSAVLRRAVSEYLDRRRRDKIREQYHQAYSNGDLGEEYAGWEEEGVWPNS